MHVKAQQFIPLPTISENSTSSINTLYGQKGSVDSLTHRIHGKVEKQAPVLPFNKGIVQTNEKNITIPLESPEDNQLENNKKKYIEDGKNILERLKNLYESNAKRYQIMHPDIYLRIFNVFRSNIIPLHESMQTRYQQATSDTDLTNALKKLESAVFNLKVELLKITFPVEQDDCINKAENIASELVKQVEEKPFAPSLKKAIIDKIEEKRKLYCDAFLKATTLSDLEAMSLMIEELDIEQLKTEVTFNEKKASLFERATALNEQQKHKAKTSLSPLQQLAVLNSLTKKYKQFMDALRDAQTTQELHALELQMERSYLYK